MAMYNFLFFPFEDNDSYILKSNNSLRQTDSKLITSVDCGNRPYLHSFFRHQTRTVHCQQLRNDFVANEKWTLPFTSDTTVPLRASFCRRSTVSASFNWSLVSSSVIVRCKKSKTVVDILLIIFTQSDPFHCHLQSMSTQCILCTR